MLLCLMMINQWMFSSYVTNVYVVIVVKKGKYVTVLEEGVKFTIPAHPGYYPAVASDGPKVLSKEEAQHKANILEHCACSGVA